MWQLIRSKRFSSYSVISVNDTFYPDYVGAGYLFIASGNKFSMEKLHKEKIIETLNMPV